MVKVINIDTKKKTIHVSNADGDIKTWRTTESGTHFPIKKGESTKEALDKFVEKKQEESPAMRAAREASDRMNSLKLAIGDKKNGVKKERSWQRGPRESEDAYFDRREKTMAEARKIDKVSDWYKKAYAGDDAFPKNKDITFDELANKMLDGTLGEFYEAVGVGESDVREKIFQELSERTGRPYDDFYDAWLHGGQKGTSGRAQKQKESIAYMDKLLELNTDMDPELRKMIVAARDRAKKELKK